MKFHELHLAGAYRIEPKWVEDERGAFARRFCTESFRERGLETEMVQRSISFNLRAGTLRGMHYQSPPHMEVKLVRCTRGAMFDVMVDLREQSRTYGHWHSEILTSENHVMVYIPQGFAHGFQTLVDDTEVDYEISQAYFPDAARGFNHADPALEIKWPITDKIISARDASLPAMHCGAQL